MNRIGPPASATITIIDHLSLARARMERKVRHVSAETSNAPSFIEAPSWPEIEGVLALVSGGYWIEESRQTGFTLSQASAKSDEERET